MIAPSQELIAHVTKILHDCPIRFEYDFVFIPSRKLELVENAKAQDDSWVGIVIYENDILSRPEPDRVLIGNSLHSARNAVREAGFRCEYFPLPGVRKDHDLDGGIPTIGTKTSMDNKP